LSFPSSDLILVDSCSCGPTYYTVESNGRPECVFCGMYSENSSIPLCRPSYFFVTLQSAFACAPLLDPPLTGRSELCSLNTNPFLCALDICFWNLTRGSCGIRAFVSVLIFLGSLVLIAHVDRSVHLPFRGGLQYVPVLCLFPVPARHRSVGRLLPTENHLCVLWLRSVVVLCSLTWRAAQCRSSRCCWVSRVRRAHGRSTSRPRLHCCP
jgi:hypothetical protein